MSRFISGFVGAGHARRRLSRPDLHRPDAGPDRGRDRGRRHGARRAAHHQELRRRRDEFRRWRPKWSASRRRACWSTTTFRSSVGRTSGRRGVAGTLVVEKIVGAAAEQGRDLADAQGPGRARQQPHALDGRRAQALHGAGDGRGQLSSRPGRDGTGRRHPWRAGPPARAAVPRPTPSQPNCSAPSLADLQPQRGEEALLLVNGFGGNAADRALPDGQECAGRFSSRPASGRRGSWPAPT